MHPSEPARRPAGYCRRRCRVLNDVTLDAGALADYAGCMCSSHSLRRFVCHRQYERRPLGLLGYRLLATCCPAACNDTHKRYMPLLDMVHFTRRLPNAPSANNRPIFANENPKTKFFYETKVKWHKNRHWRLHNHDVSGRPNRGEVEL